MQIPIDHAFGEKLPSIDKFITASGYFWRRFMVHDGDFQAVTAAFRQEARQQVREVYELAASSGFETCPQYHTETFYPVLFSPDEITESPIRYGDGFNYGSGGKQNFHYGDSQPGWWKVPKPANVIAAAAITDQTLRNGVFLSPPNDFIFESDGIELNVDPRQLFEQVIDPFGNRKYVMWLYMAQFDRGIARSRYGELIGHFGKSTDAYLLAVRAVMRAHTLGASELRLRELLAASVSEPVAETGELVDKVLLDRPTPVIITDRRSVYGTPGKRPAVIAKQELNEGDFFFDSVQLSLPSQGTPPWLNGLELSSNVPGSEVAVLPAGEIAISAHRDEDGRTVITSDEGSPALWAWLNQLEPSIAKLLADDLGISSADPANAAPELFPAQADVLSALMQSPLGYSMSMSLIRSEFLADEAAALLRLVREVVPPWVTHNVTFDGAPPPGWNDERQCNAGMPLLP